jgi:hypothetical protein
VLRKLFDQPGPVEIHRLRPLGQILGAVLAGALRAEVQIGDTQHAVDRVCAR